MWKANIAQHLFMSVLLTDNLLIHYTYSLSVHDAILGTSPVNQKIGTFEIMLNKEMNTDK